MRTCILCSRAEPGLLRVTSSATLGRSVKQHFLCYTQLLQTPPVPCADQNDGSWKERKKVSRQLIRASSASFPSQSCPFSITSSQVTSARSFSQPSRDQGLVADRMDDDRPPGEEDAPPGVEGASIDAQAQGWPEGSADPYAGYGYPAYGAHPPGADQPYYAPYMYGGYPAPHDPGMDVGV